MRLYPADPSRTLAGDLLVVLLLIVFAWAGMKVHDGIADLSNIGRSIQDSGRAISATTRNTASGIDGTFSGAAGKVQGLPLVGGDLAGILRDAPTSATDSIRAAGDEQGSRIVKLGVEEENQTYRLANLVGWITFLLPALILLAWRLPPRIRQIRTLTGAQRLLTGAPPHILAARAAYSLPFLTLQRYTADPFGDLAAGRHEALLAALAADAGMSVKRITVS